MLAIKGFILLASMSFAGFNTRVAIVLKSKTFEIILVPLYKN